MARKKTPVDMMPATQILTSSECRSIDSVSLDKSLPHVEDHLDNLAAYSRLLSEHETVWKNALFWTVYALYPRIDVNRAPFNSVDARIGRDLGNHLFWWLQLCRGVWDGGRDLKAAFNGLTPLDVWRQCAIELKQSDAISRVEGSQAQTQRQQKEAISKAVRAALVGDLGQLGIYAPTCNKVLKAAAKLRKKRNLETQAQQKKRERFITQFWNPFISSMEAFDHAGVIQTLSLSANGLQVKKGQSTRSFKFDPEAWTVDLGVSDSVIRPLQLPSGQYLIIQLEGSKALSKQVFAVKRRAEECT